ncbi:hypothetical protein [Rhodoferax sp. GW822-FHT02A01]|uniref:hypothetical protein n=1 Tax=Rhodoferax sp. GW822-FHT02A01 TaxID=3141537 RepID=UPI00315DBC2E
MKNTTIIVMVVGALQLSAPALAEDDVKVKALTDEKALLDAQTARDNAEAIRIKAASDLAKAKAASTDADTGALAAKVARDQAETAALNAAKALADAKALANGQDSANQKSQLDADAALTASKIRAQVADFSAIKDIFGAPPSIGTDGNVAITDSTTGMLLESKSGSLKATGSLASKFCAVLAARKIKDAFIAPTDLDRRIVASSLVLRDFKELSQFANQDSNKGTVGLGAKQQIAVAGVLSAVSMLQYGAGAIQTIAKMFRSDYTVSIADGRRETWLEYFMVASCPMQVPRADVETIIRAKGINDEMQQLNEIAKFVDAHTTQKALQTAKLEKAILDAKTAKDKDSKADTSIFIADANSAKASLDSLAMLDGPVSRMKTLLDGVTSKPDAFVDAVSWSHFAGEYKDKPRITVAFTTQDGQVTRTHWLTGKHVYGRSSGELVFRVVDAAGIVQVAGYLVATNSDGEFDFKASAIPEAKGETYYPGKEPGQYE